ncbi:hypothetical protein J7J45_02310 [Candidatus Aerophobetes bacterium]|nr:hypothetical protein [Candidatus Aerophobetes bacterium]
MAEIESIADRVWEKALKDEAYRERLLANPATELKKEGLTYIPDDLKVEIKEGKLTFSTSDQLALEQLNKRVTKSK